MFDLLPQVPGRKELKVRERDGVAVVEGLQKYTVKSVQEMEAFLQAGNRLRSTAQTNMNDTSSRSHSIFSITVECATVLDAGTADAQRHVHVGKLNLVDLAGSERQNKTGATGDRLREACDINRGLAVLGKCIAQLVDDPKGHIPYRDSKLTRLLQDSLGGNARTAMLATISPVSFNHPETKGTLKYADRAKHIKNRPVVNEDAKDALLRKYQDEIQILREKLNGVGGFHRRKSKQSSSSETPSDTIEEGARSLTQEQLAEMEAKLAEDRKVLESQKGLVESERRKIEEDLARRAADLEKERRERERVSEELRNLEARLVHGTGASDPTSLKTHAEQQVRLLADQAAALEDQRRQQRLLEEEIETRQQKALQREGQYATLAEEVKAKRSKFQKITNALAAVQDDIADYQEEYRIEREDLLDTVSELSRDLALRIAIIDLFIPAREAKKFLSGIMWSDDGDEWRLNPHYFKSTQRIRRPVSSPGLPRPLTQYGLDMMKLRPNDVRFLPENIFRVGMEKHESRVSEAVLPVAPQQKRSGMTKTPVTYKGRPGAATPQRYIPEHLLELAALMQDVDPSDPTLNELLTNGVQSPEEYEYYASYLSQNLDLDVLDGASDMYDDMDPVDNWDAYNPSDTHDISLSPYMEEINNSSYMGGLDLQSIKRSALKPKPPTRPKGNMGSARRVRPSLY